MKKLSILFLSALAVSVFTVSCNKDDDNSPEDELIGQPGNPRFNLRFTNEENVDLDLYVRTPEGNVIYYGNPAADDGELDVDCLCGACPQGPNENIYWEDGTAPSGTYEYWVDYYGSCTGSEASSNYTLRVVRNEQVIATETGTLSSGQSAVFTHVQN